MVEKLALLATEVSESPGGGGSIYNKYEYAFTVLSISGFHFDKRFGKITSPPVPTPPPNYTTPRQLVSTVI